MEEKEKTLRAELQDLDAKLQDPAVFSDKNYPRLAKRKAELDELIGLFDEQTKLHKLFEDTNELGDSGDPDIAEMANAEMKSINRRLLEVAAAIKDRLTPQDPNNDRDVIMEIRAAAGGDEASLFAGDLYRMYARWAENHGFKLELLNESPSESGGFKEITFAVR